MELKLGGKNSDLVWILDYVGWNAPLRHSSLDPFIVHCAKSSLVIIALDLRHIDQQFLRSQFACTWEIPFGQETI